MKRRNFLANAAALGFTAAAAGALPACAQQTSSQGKPVGASPGDANKLTPPESGTIPVAVAITAGATVIDFAGPWEVFQDVMFGTGVNHRMPFQLFTVSDTTDPVICSAGIKIVPDYTFETAPPTRVAVVGAQRGSKGLHEWLRKVSKTTDVTMSVCTGAFQLARAGLLAGLSATTHHDYLDGFEKEFPDVKVKRGFRFVEGSPRISTAGGLSSGIDLALRVVERYYGRDIAKQTAAYLEYQSTGWMV